MTDTPPEAAVSEPQPASVANLKMLSPETRESMLSVAERVELAAGEILSHSTVFQRWPDLFGGSGGLARVVHSFSEKRQD